jgi:hypothetical protein
MNVGEAPAAASRVLLGKLVFLAPAVWWLRVGRGAISASGDLPNVSRRNFRSQLTVLPLRDSLLLCALQRSCLDVRVAPTDWLACRRYASLSAVASGARPNWLWRCCDPCWLANLVVCSHINPRGDGCSDVEASGETDVATGACSSSGWWWRRCRWFATGVVWTGGLKLFPWSVPLGMLAGLTLTVDMVTGLPRTRSCIVFFLCDTTMQGTYRRLQSPARCVLTDEVIRKLLKVVVVGPHTCIEPELPHCLVSDHEPRFCSSEPMEDGFTPFSS